MTPTVRSVLDSPGVRRGRPRVLAGEAALDRTVRWVHVSEVADPTGLLAGDELILTTGLPLREAPAAFVDALAAAGAAGLIVELGPVLPRVPDEAVACAEAHGLPLIALDETVRFVEITEEVHRGIVAGQVADLEFGRTVHDVFTDLSLEGADPARVVEAASDLCGAPVVLEDLTRYVVAHAGHATTSATLLERWEDRSRLAPSLDRTGTTGPEGWTTAPVGTRGRIWGRLVVLRRPDGDVRVATVLERAAQALELGRMTERDRSDLVRQAQSGLLRELADGEIAVEADALARARALGVPDATTYVCVVVQDPRVADLREDPVAEHGRGRRMVDRVSAGVRGAGLAALVGPLRAHQVAVVLACPNDVEARLDRLTAVLPTPFLLGVAEPAPTLLEAGARLGLAQHVAESAAALPEPSEGRRWFRGADVRLHGLLAQLHDDPRVQRFAEAELGTLLAHDAAHGTDLVALLRAYVEAGGNKTVLARRLHQSRTALYKRLERLERILGTRLDEPVSLLSLGVAVWAYDHSRARRRG
ncbi:PucR family transcriptional regulator [Alteromonas gracilis]